jgi:Uma2 family endonuclease
MHRVERHLEHERLLHDARSSCGGSLCGCASIAAVIRECYFGPMTVLAKKKMTVDDYIAWSLAQSDTSRADLIDGEVYAHAAERVSHLRVKHKAASALDAAIAAAKLSCHVLPDGATVRITDMTAFEPDALVYCGPELPGDAIEVPNPIIVVEVLSPDSEKRDMRDKLAGYFLLPSVEHYLIIDPEERLVIHHTRGQGDVRGTRLVREGELRFDPPGIVIAVADFFR